MKRVLCTILALLTLLISLPVFAAEAEPTDCIEFTAYEMLYTHMQISTFGISITHDDAGTPILHLTSKTGTYDNNQYVLSVSASREGFNMLDYPYVKIGYRTNSPTTTLDASIRSAKGENWEKNKSKQVTDGEFHDVIVNINNLSAVESSIPDYEDGTTMSFRIKPLGSGDKVFTQEYYYDLMYYAFFKTEADALAYTYNYSAADDDYKGITEIKLNYSALTSEKEDEILSGAESLKQTILNAESISPDTIEGTVYYVSNDGDDTNTGTSVDSPLATLAAVSNLALEPGDAVFFKRGDLFRGQLKLKSGVTYSSYGEGDKPKLYHSVQAADEKMWQATQYKNVWVYAQSIPAGNDIGNIIINGGEAWGIKISRETDRTRQHQDLVYNGYESFVSSGDMPFEDQRDLCNNLEYWHSWESGLVYMYCDYGNPGKIFDSIEISKKGNVVSGSSQDVLIDNLAIGYTGSHGIGVGSAQNFKVQYCTFDHVGGSLQYTDGRCVRYGNAVENWGSCDGYYIDHCYAVQTYDCCYTTQWQGENSQTDIIMKNVVFSNTVSEYSNSGPEVWLAANDGDTTHTYLIQDMEAYNNYVLYGGYGWSHQRPNKDGNFFYGGAAGTSTVFDNVEYHDNFFFKATHIAVKARYSKLGYGYNFRNNTFVMAEGLAMVETGNDLTNCTGSLVRYKFNQNELRSLVFFGYFPDCDFYYYDIADAAVPMPDREPPRDPDFDYETVPTPLPSDYILISANELLSFADTNDFHGMTYENKLSYDENGTAYFRINSKAGTYNDGLCVHNLKLKELGYEITLNEYPVMKIGYKTNITSGGPPLLNFFTTYDSKRERLWGPTFTFFPDETPKYDIIGAKIAITGGHDITDFSQDKIATDAIYETLHMKFWGAQTITVEPGEYLDISYIAFFKDMPSAAAFTYPDTAPILGDVNDDDEVNAADEILLTRYNASIRGYLSLDNLRAADLNNDNFISVADGVILARHIAGWSKYASLPYEN